MSGILTFFRSLLPRAGVGKFLEVPLPAKFLVVLAVVAAGPACADPHGAWSSGVAGSYPTASEACHAQWIWAGYGNNRSRFIGALPSDVWWVNRCSWTQFQYLCPEETPGQPGSCGTTWPGSTTFTCASGYTRVSPGVCKPDAGLTPERPECYNDGGNTNASTGKPIILSTGSKILAATDFVSEDGRFRIGRSYRSFPGGYNTSLRRSPLGLATGWQFNFEMELHLGTFSGSPSSPTGNVTLLAPDGSAYDFLLNASGQFLPRTASGAVSYDYKVEFVGTLPSTLSTIYDSQTEWRITGPDDRVWTLKTFSNYNVSPPKYYFGRPTEITERDGYEWTLNYASDGSLSTIVDTFGRTATFSWNLFYITFLTGISGSLPYPEAVDTITFPDGTSVKYDYDPPPAATPPSTTAIERLIGVTLRDSALAVADSTTYHYEDPDFTFAVTGITDHRNVRIATYQYDDLGRAVLEKGADDQEQVTVSYGTSAGLVTRTVTNPLGRDSVYKFEKIGSNASDIRLVGVDGEMTTHCPSTAAQVAYGVDGFISSTIDDGGHITRYVRDARGRPTQITLAYGRPETQQISITWDTTFNVPAVIARPGLTATRVYDGAGRLVSLTETDTTTHTLPYPTNGQTRVWTYTYTTGGLVATIDGPLPGTGDTVSYTYDAAGYVHTYTDELGFVTTVNSVNGRGQPTEVEDANGLVTSLTYDAVGRVISTVSDPSGVAAETTIEYDNAGNTTKVTRPDGSFLQMAYDDNSRVASITNALGDNIQFTYDTMGNVTSRKAYNGFPQLFFQWQQAFDELGRVIELTGAGPASWAYGYDKANNLTSVTDPNGNAASMAYDGLDRLITFVDERASITRSTYGDTDQPATTTDPNSVVTSYVRNGWGEAIQEQSNDIGAIVYQRNQKGQVTERTDARGVVADFTYDDAARITAVAYPGETALNVTYTYDSTASGNKGVGRLTGVTDAAGTVGYVYDLLGRVIQEQRVIGSQTYTTAYGYDAAGNVVTETYPSGRIVFFDRDPDGKVGVIRTLPQGGSMGWLVQWVGRTPFGPRSGVVFGNGMREWRHYDEDGRITELETLIDAPSTHLIDWTYAYSDKRNLTGITDVLDAANNETYAYGDNGFLQAANGPWDTLPATSDVYSVSAGSNRLAGIASNGSPSRSFTSDAAGNIATDTDAATSKAYSWNSAGQLGEVKIGGVSKGTYAYDYLSRLAVRQLPASSTVLHYVHDLDGNVIAEYDGAGALLREYVWLEDRPVAAIAAGTTPVTYWVHTDHLERPAMMTDETDAVVWRAKYLPYGEVYSITGPASLDYRLPGQWFQLESGLNYNWHRHYDPTTGRYLQPDPLGMPDGPSRWAYVQNSPLMGVDREGLKTDGLSRTLLPSPKPSLLMSVPKLDEPDGPLFCETKVEKEERCFQQCQHLMGVGHGNEYRGCFRRCMGEFLGP
ncbi:RHS repeat-associated core domain-containing protein [Mesorhizobium abyssinicae]|uniref:RHS repeat-associated core domain-containing protein n=2 Tax=Mesorhizobium TaxID=68287 RepID=UPI003CF1A857